MSNPWDGLKDILSSEASSALANLWESGKDKAFLQYNAEQLAKYVLQYKDPTSTQAAKDEAKVNLDMLRATVAQYVAQKAVVGAQSAEETGKAVMAFLINVLIKAV
jgi:hypothetical protein